MNEEMVSNLNLSDADREQMIEKLAEIYHTNWTKTLEDEYGHPEVTERKTTDTQWIADNGEEVVDVANTSYPKLPADQKLEFQQSAKSVLAIIDAMGGAINFGDDQAINTIGEALHREWLEKNQQQAAEEEKRPFAQLPDRLKAMIIAQVKDALKLLNI